MFCPCHPSRQANHPWGRAPMFPLAVGVYKSCLRLKFRAKAKTAQILLSLLVHSTHSSNKLHELLAMHTLSSCYISQLITLTFLTFSNRTTVTANDVGKQRLLAQACVIKDDSSLYCLYYPNLRTLDGKKDHARTRHVTMCHYMSFVITESLPSHRSGVLGVCDLLLVRHLGTAPSWCSVQRALWRRLSAHDGHLCLQKTNGSSCRHMSYTSRLCSCSLTYRHLHARIWYDSISTSWCFLLLTSIIKYRQWEHGTSKTLRSATFSDGKEVMSCAP